MRANVRVLQSFDGDGKWSVAVDGQYVVGFYGPGARQLAERQRDELAELIELTERPISAIDRVMHTPGMISTPSDEDRGERKGGN